jgi:hypothetical protein
VTVGGWILLALSWGGIIIAASYCMAEILREKRQTRRREEKSQAE